MDDKVKSLLNEIKSEKKKNKNFDKIKQLEIELVKIKYSNNPDKLQNAWKELNKTQIVNRNLREFKNEILRDHAGEIEIAGRLKIADQTRETHIRFRNKENFECYTDTIDHDYEWEDAIFNGYNYKINTLQIIRVNGSQFGNGCDFKNEVIEYRVNNCYIPPKIFVLSNVLIS